MVEFVFAVPLLLLFIVSIIYFGKLFLTKQVLAYAAQEGARAASRIPDLSNPQVRDYARGFTTDGAPVGPDDPSLNTSPVYRAMSAGRLLSGADGTTGALPPGARVVVSPFDDGSSAVSDAITMTVEYPFGLFFNPRQGGAQGEVQGVSVALSADPSEQPVPFADFVLRESATAAAEVYQ